MVPLACGGTTAYDRLVPTEKAFVKVYVSDDEHERLRVAAAERGLSLSSFAHARLFDDELPVELRMVLMDFAERLGVLEAWHQRTRAERARREAQRPSGPHPVAS